MSKEDEEIEVCDEQERFRRIQIFSAFDEIHFGIN